MGTGSLTFTYDEDTNPLISYEIIYNSFNDIPFVDVNFAGIDVALNGIAIGDGEIPGGTGIEVFIGSVSWLGGNQAEVLLLEFYGGNSVFTDTEWLFELGGDALPNFSKQADLDSFQSQITGLSAISSGPFAPGIPISLTSIDGITEIEGPVVPEPEDLVLRGSVEAETLTGGGGDDEIFGLGGDDIISGGAGNDAIRGGKQEDIIYGDAGNDRLFGQRNADEIFGCSGDDILNGGGGNDTLYGEAGNDYIKGGTREDIMNGGDGNDRLFGNSFSDTLNGGGGNDSLNGGGGEDTFDGGSGNDTMKGGAGDDAFLFEDGHGSDIKVQDFDAVTRDEVILLQEVSGFNSIDDVLDAATVSGNGVLIQTGSNSSIFLNNLQLSDLDANDFIF